MAGSSGQVLTPKGSHQQDTPGRMRTTGPKEKEPEPRLLSQLPPPPQLLLWPVENKILPWGPQTPYWPGCSLKLCNTGICRPVQDKGPGSDAFTSSHTGRSWPCCFGILSGEQKPIVCSQVQCHGKGRPERLCQPAPKARGQVAQGT